MAGDVWTLAEFLDTAREYNLHLTLVTFKRDVLAGVSDPNTPEAVAVAGQIAEHDRQLKIHEDTLRRFVARFPRLRSHWAVMEYELNFLDP